jgi:hypothetical protein
MGTDTPAGDQRGRCHKVSAQMHRHYRKRYLLSNVLEKAIASIRRTSVDKKSCWALVLSRSLEASALTRSGGISNHS